MAKGRKTGGRDFVPGDPRRGPGGRGADFEAFKQACRGRTEKALLAIDNALDGEDPKLALEAAKVVLERGWGKPQSAPEDIEALRDMGPGVSREVAVKALERLAEGE